MALLELSTSTALNRALIDVLSRYLALSLILAHIVVDTGWLAAAADVLAAAAGGCAAGFVLLLAVELAYGRTSRPTALNVLG